MRFVAILGDAGSGKTTLMTYFLLREYANGSPIIANYKMLRNIPFTLMPFSTLITMPESLIGAAVGMDELGKGADSYDFFSKQSRKLTTLVAESRKRHCTVYFTVQRFNMIALRLRQQVSGFIFMRDLDADVRHCRCVPAIRDSGRCRCGSVGYVCKAQFEAVFCDSNQQFVRREVFDGKPVQGFFDTDEIIWGTGEHPLPDQIKPEKDKARATLDSGLPEGDRDTSLKPEGDRDTSLKTLA